jgi:hypothetical protein
LSRQRSISKCRSLIYRMRIMCAPVQDGKKAEAWS